MSSINNQNDNLILIFTRYPTPGKTKTRLIPALGAEKAAILQKQMTEFVIKEVKKVHCPFIICYTGATEKEMKKWLGENLYYLEQRGENLGERLTRAFHYGFKLGYKKIVAIGIDCIELRANILQKAFDLLDKTDCVIGPADDGGYYLIGTKKYQPELFEDIDWGTEKVFKQTVNKIKNYKLLPKLKDIDYPEDIPEKISVIIPTLNEEKNILETIKNVNNGFNIEIIIADGGSTDNTLKLLKNKNVKIVKTKANRAIQMNKGGSISTGTILLFLHADTILPNNWDIYVRNFFKQHGDKSLGFFKFQIKENFYFKKIIEFGTNIRSNFFKLPYGDQAFFIKKDLFIKIGGFPEVPILEDYLFVTYFKKFGKIHPLNIAIKTSGRRWLQNGILKTTVINQSIILAYKMGYNLELLKKAYKAGKNPFFYKP